MGKRSRQEPVSPQSPARREPVWEDHPIYGPIPYSIGLFSGYDLNFEPELPPGAIRGRPARQGRFCSHCCPPKYFYLDQELRCRACGALFTWPAEQQRHWYEDLKLTPEAHPPSRCQTCGRQRRTERRLRRDLEQASRRVADRPDDVDALLALAAATAEHVEQLGSGSLDRGVAAARRAARQDPGAHAAHFWEGACHDVAGRREQAIACYDRFVGAARRSHRLRSLVERAYQRRAVLRRD